MLFDQAPRELPVATVRTHGREAIAVGLSRWLTARWTWLRPRTVPVIVAFVGMIAVLASVNALSNLANRTPDPVMAAQMLPPTTEWHSAEALTILPGQPFTQLETAPLPFAMFPASSTHFVPVCAR